MAAPIRVLIPGDSQDPEILGLALAYAQEIAKKAEVRDVVLLTHTKDQLRHTELAQNLGENVAKALLAGRAVSLPSGSTLRYGTLATLRYDRPGRRTPGRLTAMSATKATENDR